MITNKCTGLTGVAAIFVVYLASAEELIAKLRWLSVAGGSVILVDNTPGRSGSNCQVDGIYHHCMGNNKGIAAALNQGLEICKKLGARYIFTFDQDSDVDRHLIESMLIAYRVKRQSYEGPLAMGPYPINITSGVSYLRRKDRLRIWIKSEILRKPAFDFLQVSELITSGLLADEATYACVGIYREELFIDFVDHEWTWRLTKLGGSCFTVMNAKMAHMIGRGDIPFTGGMRLGSPARIYFLFRNGIFLALTGEMPTLDTLKFLALMPAKFIVFGLLGDRLERWGNIFFGIRAGVASAIRGKIENRQ